MKIVGTVNQIMVALIQAALDPTKEWVCELREKRAKRSLNANGYYWELLGKLAEWSGKSEIYIHNDMLEHYGQPELQEGEPIYMMLLDTINYKELAYAHLAWTNNVRYSYDGRCYRAYKVMKGSHEYDTKEFSRLVDGLIQTIIGSDAPIETMTPAELAGLKGYAA